MIRNLKKKNKIQTIGFDLLPINLNVEELRNN